MEGVALVPWEPNDVETVPKYASDAVHLTPFAKQLRAVDQEKVIKAFNAGLFELAVEYVWKRTMAILKRQLSLMGMSFVGEMLARPDIDEDSPVELVVTDYEAIQLAHQLGVISRLGSIELRQSAELLSYYSGSELDDGEELDQLQALGVLRSCVVHILARDKIDAALNFADFRRKLTQAVLPEDHPDLLALLSAPYFFKRTTIRVLLAEAKTGQGAQVENALANLGTIVSHVWGDLKDPDRWQVGQAYAEANANNRRVLSATFRRMLMTVQGFDYVPETLRSSTYTRAAKDVLSAHEGMNNFRNEAAPMRTLAMLGSTIPGPAFQLCMRATLAVKLGNKYGHSWDAQPHADKLLRSLSRDRWGVYLSRFLSTDEMTLAKLSDEEPAKRWIDLVNGYQLEPRDVQDKHVAGLIKAGVDRNLAQVQSRSKALYRDIGA